MHFSHNDILSAASERSNVIDWPSAPGYRYAVVVLGPNDSSDNPASTKRLIVGPGVWLWEIHPSGVSVWEYDDESGIEKAVREKAARVAA